MERKLEDLEYDLELERVAGEIIKNKAKKVLIQLPDGLKIYAKAIVNDLKARISGNSNQLEPEIYIWLGSCFGACDIPSVSKKDFDMIVQFGHSKWES